MRNVYAKKFLCVLSLPFFYNRYFFFPVSSELKIPNANQFLMNDSFILCPSVREQKKVKENYT